MLSRRRAPVLVVAACCWAFGASAHAQSSALFVEDFNRLIREDKTAAGVTYTVEGRVSSVSGRLLRLRKCPTSFRPAEGEELTLPRGTEAVELTGRVEKRDGRAVFVVRRLKPLADCAARYRIREGRIRGKAGESPEPWYQLARWVGRRASFYDDEKLQRLADEAKRNAIEIEKRQLPDDDPEKLRALAEKAADLGLPESLGLEYLHEAYRARWKQLQRSKQPRWQALIEQLEKDLPGCTERLPTPQPELEKRYRDHPIATYQDADDSQRRKLHRLLYIDVVLSSILESARPDDSNGYEIAESIDERLPEKHRLAETYRDRELAYRFSKVETLTRQEMLDLADRLRRRNQPGKAQSTVEVWLAAAERQWRHDGPAGLMRAADEYIDLLEDRDKAARLLLEADQLSPGSPEIAAKLKRLGYRLSKGEWIRGEKLRALPDDPIQRAARQGRVIPGMSGRQVRGTLGKPTSVTRIATAGEISELWVYGEHGASRLSVHLRRLSHREDPLVVGVSQISPD